MILIPAVDIKDGKVVRLVQGRFDDVTEYSKDPVSAAKQWEAQGAQRIHVVDLDGAKDGEMANFSVIKDIAQAVEIPIEVGGGIRTIDNIQNLIEAGVSYTILGTKSIEDKDFLKDILVTFRNNIIISLDCSNGKIAQRGWTSVTDLNATDFAKEIEQLGVQCIVYTDIARDGMLTGPNLEGLKTMLNAVSIPIIASGGIGNLEHVKQLLEMKNNQIIGAITGKAIYEGTLDFKEALGLCMASNG